MSILLDAGPSLNFLAVGQQNILVQVAASHSLQLAAPQRVDTEVEGMTNDPRFRRTAVLGTWQKLKMSGRLLILDDSLTSAELTTAVTRISGMPAKDRVRSRKSLGEIMVLAHATVYAQQGQQVFVLMDESDGRRRAKAEQRWLRAQEAPGRLHLWSTPQILHAAANRPGWIVGDLAWEAVYDQMRKFDDGLPPRSAKQAEDNETAYLLRSPENARRMISSIERLEAGEGIQRDLAE